MDLSCEFEPLNPNQGNDDRRQCTVCGYTAHNEEYATAHKVCSAKEAKALFEFRKKNKKGSVYHVNIDRVADNG